MAKRHAANPTPPASPPLSPRVRGRVIRFAILFTLLVALGSLTELFVLRAQNAPDPTTIQSTVANLVDHYQTAIARLVGGVAHAITDDVHVSDKTVRIKHGSVVVAVECTGIKASAIFCAAVLAFPTPWSRKLWGLLIGTFGVAMLNFLRIATLAYVKGFHTGSFDTVHALLMQGFLILFVSPLWVLWMFRATRVPKPITTPEPAS